MQLAFKQLTPHLAKGMQPVYVLTGDEHYGHREAIDALRQKARELGVSERESYVVERGFNWQKVSAFGDAMSLFATLRLLEIHIPSGKPGTEGAEVLQQLASQGLPDTFVIIVMPEIDWRDKKSAWYQALEQSAVVIPLQTPPPQELPQWIAQQLAKQQQTTDAETLTFVAHQVEGNLLAADQEIRKLGLLFPAGNLSGHDVRNAILNVSRYDPDQLTEAVLAGDVSRTTRILQGLKEEGVAAITIANPLIWAIKPLLKLKLAEAGGEPLASAMTKAKLFGERQAQAKRAIARLSLKQLEAAHAKLAEIDKTIKGLLDGDAWLELSRLCVGLARIKPRR